MRGRLRQLLADTRKILKLYGCGALLFFVGLGMIVGSDRVFEPSLRQEVYVLVGLLVGGSGFVIAIAAQLLLIWQRFSNLGNSQNKK